MIKHIFQGWLLGGIFLLTVAAPAFANREGTSLSTDHRIRVVPYQPDVVYKYTGHYRYQSSIEFGEDEKIVTISMGDSTAWMLNPSGHRLFLKPIEQDATTNMTLITNKHSYLFELHARDADDIDDKQLTFVMRFIYPSDNQLENVSGSDYQGNIADDSDVVPEGDVLKNPQKYNFKYTISGPENTAPIRIFDDGEFTYFQFRDKSAELPAIFWVDSEGNESLINYRTRGDYIVVERVENKFTLRHGNDVNCVFNEAHKLDNR